MNTYYNCTDNKVYVNYKNISKNIDVLNTINNKSLIAVIKNDAYNLGIKGVVKECVNSGVNTFAVANLSEALEIREIDKEAVIIILNPILYEDYNIAYYNNIHLLASTLEQITNYNKFLLKVKGEGSLKFHLVFNCGMNRYGFKEEELEDLIVRLDNNKLVKENVVGLMTHYPQADDDLDIHETQLVRFVNAYEILSKLYTFSFIHSENSAAFLLNDPRLQFCNYGRVGIALYGYRPCDFDITLYPTMYLHSRVVNIRAMKKGEYLGYGDTKVDKDCVIAICPIGYGDGVIGERKIYPVFINNKRYDISGNISMSHTYIEVDDNVRIDDVVEIYGENIRFDDIKGVTNSRMMCSLKRSNKME